MKSRKKLKQSLNPLSSTLLFYLVLQVMHHCRCTFQLFSQLKAMHWLKIRLYSEYLFYCLSYTMDITFISVHSENHCTLNFFYYKMLLKLLQNRNYIMECCMQLLRPQCKQGIDLLERVQKRARNLIGWNPFYCGS